MARSKFSSEMVRKARTYSEDGQRLMQLCWTATEYSHATAKEALERDAHEAANLISNEGFAIMAEMLRDEARIEHVEFEEIKRKLANRLQGNELAATEQEIVRHARAIGNAPVRAWLQRMLDLSAGKELSSDDVLPRELPEPSWKEVWNSVASYNVEPRGARRILRALCEELLKEPGAQIELPRGLSLSKSVVQQAVEMSATTSFRRPV